MDEGGLEAGAASRAAGEESAAGHPQLEGRPALWGRAKRAFHCAVAQPAVIHGLVAPRSGEPAFARTSVSWRGPPLAQALAGQLDAIGVVNDAVEDGVGERGNADQVMPAVYGNLAGDDERAFVVAILDDFEQIARLVGRERFGSPIIQDEQFDAREGPQEPGVARIAMGDGEIGEEPGGAGVEDGHVFSTRLVAERASEPTLAQAARPGQEQIAALGDPVASGELEEERAVEPARDLIVDVLDAGWMTQARDPGARFELLLSAQRQLVFEQQTEPVGMIEAADFGFVLEFLEPFGQAVKTEGVQLVERRVSEHGFPLNGSSRDRADWRGRRAWLDGCPWRRRDRVCGRGGRRPPCN